jgi:hypothetical protein
MNQKILDIAIDCANQLEWDYTTDPEFYTYSEYNVEKFVRSIIEESMKRLNEHALEQGDVLITVGTVEKLLKKHFEING